MKLSELVNEGLVCCPQCDMGEEIVALPLTPEYDEYRHEYNTVCGICGWMMQISQVTHNEDGTLVGGPNAEITE